MKRSLIALATLLLAFPATAFEVKGFTPGMTVAKDLVKDCVAIDNADSGVPGYRCETTLGGEPAQLRLAVFEDKLVAAIFSLTNAHLTPILDALSEKYGRPIQRNPYIKNYNWSKGRASMALRENRVNRGFSVLLMDFDLYERAKDANKDKAKKDI